MAPDPRAIYVGGMQKLKPLAERSGFLGWTERQRLANPNSAGAHVGSMFAIFDVDEMARRDTPWWTYQAAAVVDAFLKGRRDARVFEFGSGASTVWLARRAGHVDAVEHHAGFAETVKELLAGEPGLTEKVDLHLVEAGKSTGKPGEILSQKPGFAGMEFTDYVDTINKVDGKFDLISIDGRVRQDCLAASIGHLADDGIIVYDDSYRPRYRSAIKTSGLVAHGYGGLVPSLPHPSVTTILSRG